MTTKIAKLEIENVKRVKALRLEPTKNGLTILGGKNGQGKTSVLDSIAWALGGNAKRPSQPNREGSVNDPYLKVTMDNGLIVERKGKNSDLKVTDPSGQNHGQALLNTFVEELAIDLPKFMDASNKEKANILLKIIGVGDQLHELEMKEKELYDERTAIGRIAKQKEKYADELPYYDDAPDDYIKASELVQQQQEILARNGRNQELRREASNLKDRVENQVNVIQQKQEQIERLQSELAEMQQIHEQTKADLATAQKTASELQDESTKEIEDNIAEIEEINDRVKTNENKDLAEDEARKYKRQYEELTDQIESIRDDKNNLLTNADLPLPELSVEDGELIFKGQKWDNMSSSEQLRVSTAIVRQLKPKCGFVLIDKLEQMDQDTLSDFGKWLESEGLQAIAARVSTGDECTIIIENGEAVGQSIPFDNQEEIGWKGEF